MRLDVGDVKVEGGEGVALGADGAGLVLAAVVGGGLGDFDAVPRCAFHGEPVPRRGLVDRLAVLQPLKLEWWLLIKNKFIYFIFIAQYNIGQMVDLIP